MDASLSPQESATNITWPPEFSGSHLREMYPDIAHFDDTELRRHYELYGRGEGRMSSPGAAREHFVTVPGPDLKILEIGPFCNPVFEGPSVRYLDVLDAEELRARGAAIGLDLSRSPETIHYTSGLSEAAGEQFDIIFSSHNLEHQPDLITHLREAADALAPGGVYMLIIPDRRFCFDHFLPDSPLPHVVGAFVERHKVHTAANVMEHYALTCHNDALAHWRGEHGPQPHGDPEQVMRAMRDLEAAAGGYVDVHAWQFTPDSFRRLIDGLNALGLCPFVPHRVYDTPYGRFEFTAVLTLKPDAT